MFGEISDKLLHIAFGEPFNGIERVFVGEGFILDTRDQVCSKTVDIIGIFGKILEKYP